MVPHVSLFSNLAENKQQQIMNLIVNEHFRFRFIFCFVSFVLHLQMCSLCCIYWSSNDLVLIIIFHLLIKTFQRVIFQWHVFLCLPRYIKLQGLLFHEYYNFFVCCVFGQKLLIHHISEGTDDPKDFSNKHDNFDSNSGRISLGKFYTHLVK